MNPDVSEILVDLEPPTIPPSLREARRSIRFRGFRDEFPRALPLSLALGGVLNSLLLNVTRPGARPWWTSWAIVVTWIIALLGVPAVRVLTMSNEERAGNVRRLTRRNAKSALFYLLFHQFNSLREAVRIQRLAEQALKSDDKTSARFQLHNIREKRRIESALEYPTMLAARTFDLYEFRSVDLLFEYLRFSPDRLRASVGSYVSAALSICDGGGDTKEGEQRAHDAKTSLERQLRQFDLLLDPELAWDGLSIVMKSGTGAAVSALEQILFELNRKSGTWEQARALVNLVNTARGFSLARLADLEEWKDSPEAERPPTLNHHRYEATNALPVKFEEYVKRNQVKDLTIVTSGYSTAVLRCVRKAKELGIVRRVHVLEVDTFVSGDSRQMKEEIGEAGIEAHLVRPPLSQAFRASIDMALIGFEAINPRGDLVHPRGIIDALEMLSTDPKPRHIVAVGESWKVRDFADLNLDHSIVAVYPGSALSCIITDHDAHEFSAHAPPDLGCCETHWSNIRDAVLTSPPSPKA